LTGWDGYLKLLSSRWFLGLAAAGIFAALLLFKIDNYAYYIAGQTLVNLVIGVCVDRSVRFPDTHFGRLLNLTPIKFVGVLSYSLYLWQEPFLNPFDEASFNARFPWNLGFAIAAAVASYYVVERPFLKFRRYFSKTTDRSPRQEGDQPRAPLHRGADTEGFRAAGDRGGMS
jgi:peptidoglycan/LPS O-acetylase OafA/YrhL